MTDAVNRLTELLTHRREQLHALEGVVGSGVGTTGTGDVVIQLFVRSHSNVKQVERSAAALLEGIPLEVVVTGDVTAAEAQEGGDDG
jgi:hypothetical protein